MRYDFFQNGESVLPAHVNIQQHEIGVELLVKRESFARVSRRYHLLVAGFLENSGEKLDVLLLIVDDKNPGGPVPPRGAGG